MVAMIIRSTRQTDPAFIRGCHEAWELDGADFLLASWKPHRELRLVRLTFEQVLDSYDSETLLGQLDAADGVLVEFDCLEIHGENIPARGHEEPEHLYRARRRNYLVHVQAVWKYLASLASQVWLIPSEGPDATMAILRHLEQQLLRENGIRARPNKVVSKKNVRWSLLGSLPGVDPYRKLPDGRLLGQVLEPLVNWDAIADALNLRDWMDLDLGHNAKGFGYGTLTPLSEGLRKGDKK